MVLPKSRKVFSFCFVSSAFNFSRFVIDLFLLLSSPVTAGTGTPVFSTRTLDPLGSVTIH